MKNYTNKFFILFKSENVTVFVRYLVPFTGNKLVLWHYNNKNQLSRHQIIDFFIYSHFHCKDGIWR